MKKIIVFLLCIPLLAFKLDNEVKDFVGKWTGEDNGQVGSIVFDEEGYASIEVGGEILGGKNFELNGKKGSMRYEINTKVKPIEVDFVVTIIETGEVKKMLGIAEFKDKNNMIFALGFTGVRPTEFNDNNAINLKREIK